MIINENTIDKFILNSLEIDCVDICLTQKTDENPIIYQGVGTIYQDINGKLNLKLYTKSNDTKKVISHHFKHYPSGRIIPKEDFFTLKAVDLSGEEWSADNLLLEINLATHGQGLIITSKDINEIISIEIKKNPTTSRKNYLFIVIPGDHIVPCNKIEKLANNSWILNKVVFLANDINFECKKLDKYLIIEASSTKIKLDETMHNKIIEALSIITGVITWPLVIKNIQEDVVVVKIKSIDKIMPNKKIFYPFKHSSPIELKDFICFFEKYLMMIENSNSDLFGFWFKINRAYQSGLKYSALSVTVSIEGLVKAYFSEQLVPDKEFLQQAKEAKSKIKDDIALGDRIKKVLFSAIEQGKKPSPKSILKQMAKDNLINGDMVNKWVKLRNKSVHPVKINQDLLTIEKFINQIDACIALFYQLVFNIIQYEGKYIDYSREGWPEKKFKINKPV